MARSSIAWRSRTPKDRALLWGEGGGKSGQKGIGMKPDRSPDILPSPGSHSQATGPLNFADALRDLRKERLTRAANTHEEIAYGDLENAAVQSWRAGIFGNTEDENASTAESEADAIDESIFLYHAFAEYHSRAAEHTPPVVVRVRRNRSPRPRPLVRARARARSHRPPSSRNAPLSRSAGATSSVATSPASSPSPSPTGDAPASPAGGEDPDPLAGIPSRPLRNPERRLALSGGAR